VTVLRAVCGHFRLRGSKSGCRISCDAGHSLARFSLRISQYLYGRVMEYVVAIVVALIAGTASSLLAPWAHWRVERQREDRAHRREQIARWRKGIATYETHAVTDPKIAIMPPFGFETSTWYAELRRHLRNEPQILQVLAGQSTGHAGRDPQAVALYAEVDRLETEWKL
jgi:hypothetical protein